MRPCSSGTQGAGKSAGSKDHAGLLQVRELAPGGIGTSCTDLATKGGVLGSALPAAAVRLHCGLWVSFWHPVRTRSSLSANRVELSQRRSERRSLRGTPSTISGAVKESAPYGDWRSVSRETWSPAVCGSFAVSGSVDQRLCTTSQGCAFTVRLASRQFAQLGMWDAILPPAADSWPQTEW